jgi:endonuclease/exonuclease/phosphatase family metal-dependent hydrolase
MQFKVMTWNVQNLFRPDDSEDAGPESDAAYLAKLTSLAAVIDYAGPDVLALQEVGSDETLQDLQQRLQQAMPHRQSATPDGRGIRVAFLSRHPIEAALNVSAFPADIYPIQVKDPIFDDPATSRNEALLDQLGRSALEIAVRPDGGGRVTLLNAHFKSKLISYARQQGLVGGQTFAPNDEGERLRYAGYALYRRNVEAMALRARINQILDGPDPLFDNQPGRGRSEAVVFCGDLNDETLAATTQIINGPGGSELIDIDLEGSGSWGGSGFMRGDQGDGYRMWNLAPRIPAAERFTRVYRGHGEMIDHIFASHRLVNPGNVPAVSVLREPDPLPSMDDDPNTRRNEPGSDHAAVVATFEL